MAWGRYKWTGRVRLSDGFVALLRESVRSPRVLFLSRDF